MKQQNYLLELYCLAICFISVICFAITAMVITRSAIGIVTPETTIDAYTYRQYQSNDNYWEFFKNRQSGISDKATLIRPPENILTERRTTQWQLEIINEKRSNWQTLITCALILGINLFVFLIHFFIRKKANSKNIDNSQTI